MFRVGGVSGQCRSCGDKCDPRPSARIYEFSRFLIADCGRHFVCGRCILPVIYCSIRQECRRAASSEPRPAPDYFWTIQSLPLSGRKFPSGILAGTNCHSHHLSLPLIISVLPQSSPFTPSQLVPNSLLDFYT